MTEDILREMILDIIGLPVKNFFFWAWKRVVSYYSDNPFDLLPFVLVMIAFPAISMNMPHISDLFQICLFVASLGLSTVLTGIVSIVIEYKGVQLPQFF